MNISHLRYLKKVVETKNITKAAKELYISQPALSKSIKALEQELGYPLLFHVGRNIELTSYCEIFYPYLVRMLEELDEGLAKLSNLETDKMTSISLYLEVASVSIPNLVKLFQAKHPEIQLSIMQHGIDEASLDEPNVFYISSEEKEGLFSIPIFTEDIYVALPKELPLAEKETIYLADLAHVSFLRLSRKNAFRRTLDQGLEKTNHQLKSSFTTDDPATLRSLINQGLGASFFPKTTWNYHNNDAFVIKPVKDFPLTRTIFLSSKYSLDNRLAQVIAEALKDFFENASNFM